MPDSDPLWYKDAIIYQLHVRAFFDSVDDGIGDFAGLTQKLDYLQDLGVTAIWLLPFYPSPLKDDGYDIANYVDVNPSYGTLRDFKRFMREAHGRGLRVITELVLNHTSDQHPWFQRARRAPPGSSARDFYVWSDTPQKYSAARIIFKDFETSNWSWDPVAKAYYWHRFYSHQPDLNFDNPAVQQALYQVLDYWLKMGIDGLRLDAVPYLYEREGTNCENLPQTHQFLKDLRRRIDEKFPNRMLLAEANQWPEDAISYFGEGDECNAAFHFPVMPRLFMAIHMEDRFPIVDILEQTPAIPANCQWFVFLRNHDELTLEMVTDEERDYMYRVYAHDRQARINLGIRRRLAPLLSNNRRKIELMNGLLFSLPGTPVIYYGDEIGMGDNIYLGDRDGVRTPMQWSGDRNAGFSRANPQQLYMPVSIDSEYHFESVNVETQHRNPQSLWWWMKRLIALRQNYASFGRGTLELLAPANQKVLAFIRAFQDESVLVVANMSRFVQYVELDLSAYEGRRPRELFGQTKFPAIGRLPYLLTLGPHAFYWFALERAVENAAMATIGQDGDLPTLTVRSQVDEIFQGRARSGLAAVLGRWLATRSWMANQARTVQAISMPEVIPLRSGGRADAFLVLLHVEYTEGEPEDYAVPLNVATGADAERILHEPPGRALARLVLRDRNTSAVICDALRDAVFAERLLKDMVRRRRWPATTGELVAVASSALVAMVRGHDGSLAPQAPRDPSSSIVYGDKIDFKLYRRIEAGLHPELEVARFLTDHAQFSHIPAILGTLEYRAGEDDEPITAGILRSHVPNSVTGWQHALDSLSRYFELVLAQAPAGRPNLTALPAESFWTLAAGPAPTPALELMGSYLETAGALGQCLGKLHAALASDAENVAFSPEPVTQLYQRSVYQSLRKLVLRTFHRLRDRQRELPPSAAESAQSVLAGERSLLERIRALTNQRTTAIRIRSTGDFHLGQVLLSGKEFVVNEVGGPEARPFTERRIKRPPLQDLACLLRSLHYASSHAFFRLAATGLAGSENQPSLRSSARYWYVWAGSALVRSYHAVASQHAGLLPVDSTDLDHQLDLYLMEKSVVEMGYQLERHPESVDLALQGILELLAARS